MKKARYIICGAVLIVLGMFWVLKILNVLPEDFSLFFPGWWTLFILVPSFMALFSDGDKTLPLIGIAVGVILLLCSLGVLDWSQGWRLMVPVILVIVGVIVLIGGIFARRVTRSAPPQPGAPRADEFAATFSSHVANFYGQNFTGASFTAVFGKLTADLSGAMVAPDSVVRVYVVFGTVDIRLPENVSAKVRVVPVFGAAGDRRRNRPAKDEPGIGVDGSVMFGSVNII